MGKFNRTVTIYSDSHRKNIDVITWRIVESQSSVTTRKFVDSKDEHELLEEIIESSKPNVKYGDEKYFNGLHYLLKTPFRYSPLQWGSRFGTRLERSLLYTSFELKTAMGETAFYKMSFLRASSEDIGGKIIPLTAFNINICSDEFVNLCEHPYSEFEESISSKTSYISSQALGAQMRREFVSCFKYKSARCINSGDNFGIISPKALLKNKGISKTQIALNCYATKEVVEFSYNNKPAVKFSVDDYIVDGSFPFTPEYT